MIRPILVISRFNKFVFQLRSEHYGLAQGFHHKWFARNIFFLLVHTCLITEEKHCGNNSENGAPQKKSSCSEETAVPKK